MGLDVIDIKITGDTITFVRILRGTEGEFTNGIREAYTLSKNVKLNIEDKFKQCTECKSSYLKEEITENGTCKDCFETLKEKEIWDNCIKELKEKE